MLGRKIQSLLEVIPEATRPLSVGTVILVFLSIFTKSQASSTFEAMNSAHLSMCQKDVSKSLSQDEKNTDVTPGMQNCSVYPKSN